MRIVALDLSLTATGVAEHDPPGALLERVSVLRPPRGILGVQRLDWIVRRIVPVVTGADLVLVEGYAHGRAHRAHELGELGGVVRLTLYSRAVPYMVVPPSSLKKFATGVGNAKKGRVLVEAAKRLGYDGHDDNEADALWLLAMARSHYGLPGAPDVPKTHIEALAKVSWPDLEAVAA